MVKGGLIVDIGLRGFLPASLVELRRVRELQPYVGRSIEAKIIELDRNRNNVVLSRRAWLEETQKEQRGEFLVNLKPGERRRGVVSSVVNFGAFVDLGGMDGLIHVSELSWKHVDHPSSVVSVGDEVEVEVLDVDLDKERISLSLKATQTDPWQEFANTHQVGELVYGRITKLVPFGAFVQVGDGIEGLVHISEMAGHHVDLPEQVVTPGEELWVKIIDIDLQRRRISLSIKQAAEGGEVSEEYREAFGEHAYDEQGNYIGYDYGGTEFTPETEAQAAWAEYVAEHGTPPEGAEGGPAAPPPPAAPPRRPATAPRAEAPAAGTAAAGRRRAEAPAEATRTGRGPSAPDAGSGPAAEPGASARTVCGSTHSGDRSRGPAVTAARAGAGGGGGGGGGVDRPRVGACTLHAAARRECRRRWRTGAVRRRCTGERGWAACSSGKWHATKWSGPMARICGSSSAHRCWAKGQRVRNRHPDGGLMGDGRSPGSGGRAVAGRAGVGLGDGGEQGLGVGVRGAVVEVVGRRHLAQLAEVHHRHPVAHVLHHGQVVGDEHHGEAAVALQVVEEVEDLRLHRHVEGGDGLVADEQGGVEHERPGDADPLALAARDLDRAGARRRRRGRCRPSRGWRAALAVRSSLVPMPQTASGSITASRTRRRGLSDEIGSWKTIWILVRAWRSSRARQRGELGARRTGPSPSSGCGRGRRPARWSTCRSPTRPPGRGSRPRPRRSSRRRRPAPGGARAELDDEVLDPQEHVVAAQVGGAAARPSGRSRRAVGRRQPGPPSRTGRAGEGQGGGDPGGHVAGQGGVALGRAHRVPAAEEVSLAGACAAGAPRCGSGPGRRGSGGRSGSPGRSAARSGGRPGMARRRVCEGSVRRGIDRSRASV